MKAPEFLALILLAGLFQQAKAQEKKVVLSDSLYNTLLSHSPKRDVRNFSIPPVFYPDRGDSALFSLDSSTLMAIFQEKNFRINLLYPERPSTFYIYSIQSFPAGFRNICILCSVTPGVNYLSLYRYDSAGTLYEHNLLAITNAEDSIQVAVTGTFFNDSDYSLIRRSGAYLLTSGKGEAKIVMNYSQALLLFYKDKHSLSIPTFPFNRGIGRKEKDELIKSLGNPQ